MTVPIHADAQGPNLNSGWNMRNSITQGVLTDANVASANTVDGIRAIFIAAQTNPLFHVDIQSACGRYLEAFNLGVNDGTFTDASIAPLTTAVGLVNLTLAATDTNQDQLA